jgi:1-acyl-sn-glycerol-3-phosphate acyltransferase
MTVTEPNTTSTDQRWRLLWRLPLLTGHLFVLTPLTLLTFLPGVRSIETGGMRLHQRAHLQWSRIMLRIFGIRMNIAGQLPEGPCLVVANHISWMDIVLLHGMWPVGLVAKAEIRDWPLIGRLATIAGTIYIRRGSEASRRRVSRRMSALLKRGERVGIFPEGGISPQPGVKRFHPRLFGAAIRADVPVVPVAIRYWRDGDLYSVMLFGPGENFFASMLRLLSQPPSRGQLMVGSPLLPDDSGRSGLARRSQDMVKSFYES